MTPNDILLLLALFTFKHFLVDFPMQRPYQWMNKGTYGHLGGIEHSGLHFVGTVLLMCWFVSYPVALMAGLVDAVIHYHIDWLKMNINKRKGWKPDTHPEFWVLLGLDQFAHTMTYIGIVWMIV
jgi:hypothetical protein